MTKSAKLAGFGLDWGDDELDVDVDVDRGDGDADRDPVDEPPAPRPVDPKERARKRLWSVVYNLRQATKELVADPTVEAAQSELRGGEATLLAGIEIRKLEPELMALGPKDWSELKPLAEAIAHEVGRLGTVDPGQADEQVRARLEAIFGALPAAGGDARATPEEALALATEKLAETRGLAGGLKREHYERWEKERTEAKDLGISEKATRNLAGLTSLVREIRPDERAALKPVTEEIQSLVRALLLVVEKGPRMRELMVRASDVGELVGLTDRISEEDMRSVLRAQTADMRGYTEEDLADFEAAAQSYRDFNLYICLSQLNAVLAMESDVHETDPPNPKPWWETMAAELAFAALSAATAGIASVAVKQALTWIDTNGAGEVVPWALKLGDIITGGMSKGIEAGFRMAKTAMLGSGDNAATTGGGDTGYLKSTYFTSQRRAIINGWKLTADTIVDDIRTLRSELRGDAPAKTKALGQFRAAFQGSGDEAYHEQLKQTRANYLKTLARAQLDEAYGEDGKRGIDVGGAMGIDRKTNIFGGGETIDLQYERTIHGMISMEARPGASPEDPVTVTAAWAAGLNQGICNEVAKMDLLELGIPMRLRVPIRRGYGEIEGYAVAGRSDRGSIWASGWEDGELWLARKGGSDEVTKAAMEEGARIILEDEIGHKPIGEGGLDLKLESAS